MDLDKVVRDLKKTLRDAFFIGIIAIVSIYGLYYLLTKYEAPISDNAIAIVTDKDGNQSIYKDHLPPHSILDGKSIKMVRCFKETVIIDTVSLLTKNNNRYHIAYKIVCNIDKDIFHNKNIAFLEYIDTHYKKYVNQSNYDIKYLCVSIPVRYGDNAEAYLNKNLATDIKWIMIHNGFNVKKIDVDLIND